MPLPETSEIWPPARFDAADELIAIWDAWYTGDTDALQVLYATTRMTTKTSLWGQVKRMFWGTPTPTTSSQVPTKLHVGVASVIARLSASTLVEDLPLIRYPKPETDDSTDDTADGATVGAEPKPKPKPKPKAPATVEEQSSERLTDILDDEAHAAILEALEFAAAHGGSYLRVTWDNSADSPVKDKPFLTTVPADGAVPEFRWGRLVAVTFWSQLAPLPEQSGVWRLLERHEPGTVEWGLYWSQDTGTLGTRVPLTDHPDTEHLAAVVDEQSQVATGSELLTAVYIPNAQPNRRLRKDPVARHLGRSDFDGAEELMDALDEAYTSWMRDIRLGKARIMVPKGMLTSMGAGNGATFNADQEIFTELGTQVGSLNPTAKGGNAESFIETFQPTIRYQEHMETCAHLLERIYAQCGYSAQTFGDGGDMAITATESVSREKMSDLTRSAKIVAVRPRLAHISAALLDVDKFVFDGPGRPEGLPDVEFSDGAAINPKIMAETLSLLNTSESASIETRVKMLHEDWDKDQVDAEVTKIKDDLAMLPDPSMAHLWMAEAANGSATGGVNAGRNGVDPSNADAVNKAKDALNAQEAAADGGPAAAK